MLGLYSTLFSRTSDCLEILIRYIYMNFMGIGSLLFVTHPGSISPLTDPTYVHICAHVYAFLRVGPIFLMNILMF